MMIVFQQKKLFYHKKPYVIGEAKTNFFATIAKYKYQLTIASS